jgi:hypothetical protein
MVMSFFLPSFVVIKTRADLLNVNALLIAFFSHVRTLILPNARFSGARFLRGPTASALLGNFLEITSLFPFIMKHLKNYQSYDCILLSCALQST